MSQNIGLIAPLNWRALVNEALRRRKAEKLTQRRHAALASVSVPTIVAFDRGERTLSLAKAFDILRVVGLVDEPAEGGAQEAGASSRPSCQRIRRRASPMAGTASTMRWRATSGSLNFTSSMKSWPRRSFASRAGQPSGFPRDKNSFRGK
jgi:transcriptional regulator with XRE-family HTH domain